jgi:hypothetical protein
MVTLWIAWACADPAEQTRTPNMRQWAGREYQEPQFPAREIFPTGGFTFCRIRYTSYGEDPQFNTRYARWLIDYPDSDQHFSWRLSELTTIKVAKDDSSQFKTAIVRLTDPELCNYPFIYIVEPGNLVFSEDEVVALRNYLLRGGFLMVDDFWGEDEWINWEEQFARVFNPQDFPMDNLPLSHPIFSCVFEIKEKPQVPNPWHWRNTGGDTSERGEDSAIVHYKGVYDKGGRLMVIVCHNTDLGDGWERETMFEDYFREMSVKRAYPMGINIVVYALTH